jgi:cytoskeletal protein CcmA (bactofilin family)
MTGSVSLNGAQVKNTGNISGSLSLTDAQVVNSGNMNGTLSLTDTQVVNSGKMAGDIFLDGAQVENNGIIEGRPFTLKDTQVSGTGSLVGNSVKLENATLIDHKITGFAEVKSNSEFKGVLSGNVTVANGQKLSLSPSVNAPKLYGTITLAGTADATTLYANGAMATLQGRTVLGGTGNNFLLGTGFVNYGIIEGKGHIQAPIENHGSIVVTDGILDVQSAITGDGKVGVSGTLKIGQNLQAGSLSMNSPGKLLVADNVTIDLKGNFSFGQLETSRWGWGSNTTLMLSGHGNVIEVGGNDFSYDLDGFSNNFNLVNLSINGAFANLLDAIDNGHRGGLVGAVDEALYVDSLYIGEGAILNLNGLHLYVKDYGLVTATDDWFNGDGRVINYDGIVPLPPTLLLVGFGLLGLAGLRIKASRG